MTDFTDDTVPVNRAQSDIAAEAPDGQNRAAGVDDSTGNRQPANEAGSLTEMLAARAGREGDAAPLGDPDAPQGSGPETDMSRPENRPKPDKQRYADADPRSKE